MTIFNQTFKIPDSEELPLDPNIILSQVLSVKRKIYNFEETLSREAILLAMSNNNNKPVTNIDLSKYIKELFKAYNILDTNVLNYYLDHLPNITKSDATEFSHFINTECRGRYIPALSPIIASLEMMSTVNTDIIDNKPIEQIVADIQSFIPSFTDEEDIKDVVVKTKAEFYHLCYNQYNESAYQIRDNLFEISSAFRNLNPVTWEVSDRYLCTLPMINNDTIVRLAAIKAITYNKIIELIEFFEMIRITSDEEE